FICQSIENLVGDGSLLFSKCESNQREDRYLRGKSFGTCNAYFRPRMGIGTCIGSTGNGGSYRITNPQYRSPSLFGQTDSGSGIGCFTLQYYRDDEIVS